MNILMALAVMIRLTGSGANLAAQPSREVPKGLQACGEDIGKFCKTVVPGKRRLARCLYKNRERLSGACRAFANHGGAGHALESLADLDLLLQKTPAPKAKP